MAEMEDADRVSTAIVTDYFKKTHLPGTFCVPDREREAGSGLIATGADFLITQACANSSVASGFLSTSYEFIKKQWVKEQKRRGKKQFLFMEQKDLTILDEIDETVHEFASNPVWLYIFYHYENLPTEMQADWKEQLIKILVHIRETTVDAGMVKMAVNTFFRKLSFEPLNKTNDPNYVIAVDTVKGNIAEAGEQNIPIWTDEIHRVQNALSLYINHFLLHTVGYDHDIDTSINQQDFFIEIGRASETEKTKKYMRDILMTMDVGQQIQIDVDNEISKLGKTLQYAKTDAYTTGSFYKPRNSADRAVSGQPVLSTKLRSEVHPERLDIDPIPNTKKNATFFGEIRNIFTRK